MLILLYSLLLLKLVSMVLVEVHDHVHFHSLSFVHSSLIISVPRIDVFEDYLIQIEYE